jgi:hypothetical protein
MDFTKAPEEWILILSSSLNLEELTSIEFFQGMKSDVVNKL